METNPLKTWFDILAIFCLESMQAILKFIATHANNFICKLIFDAWKSTAQPTSCLWLSLVVPCRRCELDYRLLENACIVAYYCCTRPWMHLRLVIMTHMIKHNYYCEWNNNGWKVCNLCIRCFVEQNLHGENGGHRNFHHERFQFSLMWMWSALETRANVQLLFTVCPVPPDQNACCTALFSSI